MSIGGKMYTAEVMPRSGELCWDDGEVWIKKWSNHLIGTTWSSVKGKHKGMFEKNIVTWNVLKLDALESRTWLFTMFRMLLPLTSNSSCTDISWTFFAPCQIQHDAPLRNRNDIIDIDIIIHFSSEGPWQWAGTPLICFTEGSHGLNTLSLMFGNHIKHYQEKSGYCLKKDFQRCSLKVYIYIYIHCGAHCHWPKCHGISSLEGM